MSSLLDDVLRHCKPKVDYLRIVPSEPTSIEDAFPMITGTQLAEPLAPINWLIDGLGIKAGAVTIVGGAGGGGKTMTMQAMAIAIASGSSVWNHFSVTKGRAIHLDYEQGRYLTQWRYQRLARSMGIDLAAMDPNFGYCCYPKGRLDEDATVRICDGAKVAIVDAFRGAFPDARENDSDARKYLDSLSRASERTGCAMIVIAHSRKASDDKDVRSSLRGSSALFDAAQTVYMLDGEPNKPTRVHCTKDRVVGEYDKKDAFGISIVDEPSPDGNLKWGLRVHYMHASEMQARYAASGDDGSDISASMDRLVSLAARVIALLSRGEHLIKDQIRAALGCGALDLSSVLASLIQQGSLRCEGKGGHAVYYTVTAREPGED